jgi:putative DNA primase/helicase
MKLWERAQGRWVEILTGLGHEDALSKKHGPCPSCGGRDRYRYLDDVQGGFFCGDLRGNGIQLLQHLRGIDFREAAELVDSIIGKNQDMEPRDNTAELANARLTARAIRPASSAYLASRGLEVPPGILFAREVPYYEEGQEPLRFDAMLAPITRNGELLTYQATYLLKGAKAPVSTVRKTLPGKPIAGGTVALYPAAECMGVAEGVETAIAAHMLFPSTPTHATLSTSGMKSWEPPPMVKEVWIFADNDANYAGHAAAYHLAHRLHKAGLAVTVMFPHIQGDWNDVLLASTRKQA